MVSRRDFLKLSGAGILSLYAATQGKFTLKAQAAIPGGTLDPLAVPKYATPLLIPPVMPKAGVIRQGGKNIDYYEISMKQFAEQILPAGFPATTVWGYGAVRSASRRGLLLHNAPSLTIEATAGRPVRVKWINDLKDAAGNYLPHILPVDPTLHWANPGGGVAGRDARPVFTETPGQYTGPVPIVTHVHGAVGVGDESDGYAEAWYLPAAANIPAGFANVGTWYDRFAAKAAGKFATAWGPGFATFQYPNSNRASTIWYHDHALGMTRLNVYAGPAGFYIIRGGAAGDAAVLDTRTNTTAVLPGPAPKEGDPFPPVAPYYEFPVAIQDRAFNTDGSLFYPNTREFFDGATATLPGYIPATDLSPIWNPEFFGNMIMVNGSTWPFQNVEQRRYRIRFLNGCQSRFLILDFSNIPGVEVWQIGNEGGFLAAPVNVTANHGNKFLLGLAERADMIVDFTNVPVGNYILGNLGPDEPFGGGEPDVDFDAADPATSGQIMEFRVVPAVSADLSTPPIYLQLPPITRLPAPALTRPLALMEEMSQFWDGPAAAMLGTVDGMGMAMHQMWMDPVTEKPNIGDTETWEFYNYTPDAHPMHVHEVVFEVVDRQPITFTEDMGHVTNTQLAGPARPPEDWESGYKDTVIAYPGEVTRIRAQFATPGQFVWHCHIVEHEDNEMMRPYYIDPIGGFPRTGILDNFNRPNGGLGAKWVGEKHRFTILNNEVKVLLDGSVRWNSVFGANQEAFFKFTTVSPTASLQALLLKFNGTTQYDPAASFIEVAYEHKRNRIVVLTKDTTLSYVARAFFPGITFVSGDIFGARALADGTLAAYKNGVAVGSVSLYDGPTPWSPAFVEGGGRIGVWYFEQRAADSGFDDFGGGTMF